MVKTNMTFSVEADIKKEFNEAIESLNPKVTISAILESLMKQWITERGSNDNVR